jgi:hypothetical protein
MAVGPFTTLGKDAQILHHTEAISLSQAHLIVAVIYICAEMSNVSV